MLGERPDVYEIMRTFDIFVLPSRDEGISNTILEAMASGLPVIATRVGGNPELVVEGEVGQLVPAQGYREMAEWMVRYARDAAFRRRQSVAARSYVETKFSMSAMVESYLSVYDRLRARREDARTLGRVKNST
jgi:glycosyltransferase involved in cell wall biosynthesis